MARNRLASGGSNGAVALISIAKIRQAAVVTMAPAHRQVIPKVSETCVKKVTKH